MRGYLKCNDGRNDYKKNAKGVRGICLLAGEVSYGEQKSARTALVQKGRQHKMKISLVPRTGGKFRVVDTLYHLFPKHTSYYEPFFGSGAVLINKKEMPA